MNDSSTVLVTGASGNIGRALLPLLRDSGAQVFAGHRSGAAVDRVAGRAVDFNDRRGLEAAFQGVDTLFLLFPLVPNKRELAAHAVAAARAAGVRHLVRSSGAGADADATGSLARLQGEIDRIVTDSGIPTTILRPATFMQNWVTYNAGMVKSGTVYLPLGEGRTAYVDVRDIAAAAAAVVRDPERHSGKVYTITGGEALAVAEVLAEIARGTGRHSSYVPVSDEAAIQAMKSMGMDDWTIDILMSLNRAAAAGETAAVTGDLQSLTGQPPRRFADFVRDHADAFR